jgi:hypothetical protein
VPLESGLLTDEENSMRNTRKSYSGLAVSFAFLGGALAGGLAGILLSYFLSCFTLPPKQARDSTIRGKIASVRDVTMVRTTMANAK